MDNNYLQELEDAMASFSLPNPQETQSVDPVDPPNDPDDDGNKNIPPVNPGDNNTPPAQESLQNSPLFHFANLLKDEGFFDADDLTDYDGSFESLAQKMSKVSERLAEQRLGGLDEEARKFAELLRAGVPRQQAEDVIRSAFDINNITDDMLEDSVEKQKEVVRNYLKETGLPDEDIDEQIEFLEDTNKLFQKSVNYHGKLKALSAQKEEQVKEAAKARQAEIEANNKKQLDQIKETVMKLEEVIPGHKLSQAMKDKIYKNLVTPAEVKDGVPLSTVALKRQEDPVKFEIMLNLLNEYGVFDGKFDLLLNAGKKQNVQEFERALQTSDFFNKSSRVAEPTSNKMSKDILESLSSLPSFKDLSRVPAKK